jgi:hypothetical protein
LRQQKAWSVVRVSPSSLKSITRSIARIAQGYIKLFRHGALRINERGVPELVDPPTLKGDFDGVLRLPIDGQPGEVEPMKKALLFVFRKDIVRRFRDANIYVMNA